MHGFLAHIRDSECSADILLVDLPEFATPKVLADWLYSKRKRELQISDAVLIRPPIGNYIEENTSLDGMRPVLDRIRRSPIHLLTSEDYTPQIGENLNPLAKGSILSKLATEKIINRLRQEELLYLLKRSRALITSGENYVYRLPSGKLDSFFIRVGNIQDSRDSIDAIFFWLIPYLKNVGAIVTDTWSIASISLNASRLLKRYDPMAPDRVRVEMLPHYLSSSETGDVEISAILTKVTKGHDKKILFLESACNTNTLITNVKSAIDKFGHDKERFRFVALYDVKGRAQISALCDLKEFRDEFLADLVLDERNKSIIGIDPQVYFPIQLTEVPIGIRTRTTKISKKFFDDYAQSGAIRVHRDYTERKSYERHHGVDIDVSKLLKTRKFRMRLKKRILSLNRRPRVIVTPTHPTGRELGRFAVGVLQSVGVSPAHFQHDSLFVDEKGSISSAASHTNEEIREAFDGLDATDSVLILDDVSTSGSTLVGYQKNLHDLFDGQIHYLVGVARPSDSSSWKKRVGMLRHRTYRNGRTHRFRHTVDGVESVVLPDWDSDECPWCQETEVCQEILDKLDLQIWPAEILDRVDLLQEGREDGLISDLVPALGNDYPISIGDHSIFVGPGAPQAVVFAAVASAVQQLRFAEKGIGLSTQSYPAVPVLHWTEHLREVFQDTSLRASVLRSTNRSEIEPVDPQSDKQRRKGIRKLLLDQNRNTNNLTWEILYQIGAKKLPNLQLKDGDLRKLRRRGFAKLAKFFLD